VLDRRSRTNTRRAFVPIEAASPMLRAGAQALARALVRSFGGAIGTWTYGPAWCAGVDKRRHAA
jgi:hypothetical protein